MNTKFNKAPRFKTVEEKKFQERPSFKSQERKPRQESERKPERRSFREERTFEKPQNIYPSEGRKASGEGSVQILSLIHI